MNDDFSETSVIYEEEKKMLSLENPSEHGKNSQIMEDIDLNLSSSNELIYEVSKELEGVTLEDSKCSDSTSSSNVSLAESESKTQNESNSTAIVDQTQNKKIEFSKEDDDVTTDGSTNSDISFKYAENEHFNSDLLLRKSKEELVNVVQELLEKRLLLENENLGYKDELEQCKIQYSTNIEALEKHLAQAKADAFAWENELKETKEKLTKEKFEITTDLTTRLERVMKQCDHSKREKESMVIKYATAEKEVLVVKKQKEAVEKKVKDLDRDKEILQGKIKSLTAERARIGNTLDNKIQEWGIANRNIEKLKEEINAKDIKIKWSQSKLKTETDAHKETQGKLDRALSKICNHEEEISEMKEGAEKIVKEAKEGENTRANTLDKLLRETKALLILETQKYNDVSTLYKQVKSDHEVLRSSHIFLETEATTLRVKVSKHDQESEESKRLFESLQAELKNVKQGAADLTQKLSHSAVYEEQLESEKSKSERAEEQVRFLTSRLEELTAELSKCREKEAELLAFTQKLTDKDVTLQSQLTASQGKVRLLDVEHNEMQTQVQTLQKELDELTKTLSELKHTKKIEEHKLSSLLQERTDEASELRTKVSDLFNEIQVLQKKQSNSLKDSNREIQKLRKKVESLESNPSPKLELRSPPEGLEGGVRNGAPHPHWGGNDVLSQESRASSEASLNTVDSSHTNGSSTLPVSKDSSSPSPIADLPQQVLIDRIIKLQKSAIKRTDKLDFLEEHVAQLVGELKKKNRLIHHYIMKEEPGALANAKSDSAKAEIMKHGGIMASVYGSALKDGAMTLDLSLEINKKLQAVLEDTLLKNITLKENLNTLGDEVAKLAHQNSHSSRPS